MSAPPRFARTAALLSALILATGTASAAADPELVSAKVISSEAPHSAFTSLVRFRDRLLCAFREAKSHVSSEGGSHIRVIASDDDGATWEPVAKLEDPRGDIRDAKLSITPDGNLVLLTAIRLHKPEPTRTYQSIAFRSTDGKSWDGPADVADPNFWLWGLRWHNGAGYSIGYVTASKERFVRLYRTTDGQQFESIVPRLAVADPFPNESAIAFDKDDNAIAVVRCDPNPAQIGTAKPPYTDWSWKQSNLRVGGPALTFTPDGRLLGGGRVYDPKPHTSLFWVDPATAQFTECLKLPSAGDTSYPGFEWSADRSTLLMSYYSSHEGKTKIYFARVRLP